MSEAQEYYKARGKLMYMLRQERMCRWTPLGNIINRIGIQQYQAIIRIEKSADPKMRRLEWTVDSIRALTKEERNALVSGPATGKGEEYMTAAEAKAWTDKTLTEIAAGKGEEYLTVAEAKARTDELLTEVANARASSSRQPSYEVDVNESESEECEVEIETNEAVDEESDDCIIVSESLQMEPLKRRRRA